MGPLHTSERCTFLGKCCPEGHYVVAEGLYAMKIMHICLSHNSSGGMKHSSLKGIWCANFAKIHSRPTLFIVDITYTPQHSTSQTFPDATI